jgi:hypothetical protein
MCGKKIIKRTRTGFPEKELGLKRAYFVKSQLCNYHNIRCITFAGTDS